MRILFFCGSLEPGRDGVGDYTRRLATECIRQGHECKIIAVNDKRLSSSTAEEEKQWDGETEVNCLRLSPALILNDRLQVAKNWVDNFDPEVCSLQFVPFSFHEKGLCHGLAQQLSSIASKKSWHVMFHELWIDWNFPLSLKSRVLGQLQKYFLSRFLSSLNPSFVQTHLSYYQSMLIKLGRVSSLLPLHGNIPVVADREMGREWLSAKLGHDVGDSLHLGFFGALLETLDLRLLKATLKKEKLAGKSLIVTSAGHLNDRARQIWQQVESTASAYAKTQCLGALSENCISHYLASLDRGLTTYPIELAGKSGAVAAMFEHGIEVCPLGALNNATVKTDVMHALPPPPGSGLASSARFFLATIRRT